MSRIKLSEYRAKQLIYAGLGLEYSGIVINFADDSWPDLLDELSSKVLYVAKVDQAIKKRNTLGLVTVKRSRVQIREDLERFKNKGYTYALVEPYVDHDDVDEHYVALQRVENGVELSYSKNGGVEVESHTAGLTTTLFSEEKFEPSNNTTQAPLPLVSKLYNTFQSFHMTYLEINPCIVQGDIFVPLDAAVEVDSSAQFFVNAGWEEADFRSPKSATHPAEKAVEMLASKSPASLVLKVLNADGSIFLLLSGGGASVVVADELSNLGYHNVIANYGEYSGNPNEEETYLYTKQVLKLLLASKATRKVLLIAGGVANFTDVAKTFKGIIRALGDVGEELVAQKVEIFIRRGGPNQERGLAHMKEFLDEQGIVNHVNGPEMSLAEIVRETVRRLEL